MGGTTGFYADEGVEHVWQNDIKLGGGTVGHLADTHNCDRFRDCTRVVYEIMEGNSLVAICEFDGLAVASGKGLGTWECRSMGQVPFKGKFASEEDVPQILQDLAKKLPKFQETVKQNLIKSIRAPSGWVVDEGSDLEADLTITKELPKSFDYVLTAIFWNAAGVANGDKETYNLSFNDYGGYERNVIFEDDGTYKSLDDIPKILKAFDTRVETWLKSRSEASAKGMKMKRSTAVALTRKALTQVRAKHVAELYPKVGVVITEKTIVFVTSREILWLGASPDDAKRHVDEAVKAVRDASNEFLKQAKNAGAEDLVMNRHPGHSGLNATKYGGLAEAFYTWDYQKLDDNQQAQAAEIGKAAKLEVNPKIKWR